MYRYYDQILKQFERSEDAMQYQDLLSEKGQNFLGELTNGISSLYKPVIEASFNKTKSMIVETSSIAVATAAYTKFARSK